MENEGAKPEVNQEKSKDGTTEETNNAITGPTPGPVLFESNLLFHFVIRCWMSLQGPPSTWSMSWAALQMRNGPILLHHYKPHFLKGLIRIILSLTECCPGTAVTSKCYCGRWGWEDNSWNFAQFWHQWAIVLDTLCPRSSPGQCSSILMMAHIFAFKLWFSGPGPQVVRKHVVSHLSPGNRRYRRHNDCIGKCLLACAGSIRRQHDGLQNSTHWSNLASHLPK